MWLNVDHLDSIDTCNVTKRPTTPELTWTTYNDIRVNPNTIMVNRILAEETQMIDNIPCKLHLAWDLEDREFKVWIPEHNRPKAHLEYPTYKDHEKLIRRSRTTTRNGQFFSPN